MVTIPAPREGELYFMVVPVLVWTNQCQSQSVQIIICMIVLGKVLNRNKYQRLTIEASF